MLVDGTDYAARLAEAREALIDRPTSQAEGLPGGMYCDPRFFEQERRGLFGRNWMAVGFVSELPNRGDVRPASIAGYELILTRDRNGQIHCFHNICRHRGMRLVSSAGSGQSHIQCGWHCWTYALDGALVATPSLNGIRDSKHASFDPAKLALLEVPLAIWHDLIFVNIDGKAGPLSKQLEPLDDRLGEVRFDLAVADGDVTEVTVPANWKFVIEGGVEDYHLPFVHKRLQYSDTYRYEDGGNVYQGFSTRRSVSEAHERYSVAESGKRASELPTFPLPNGVDETETVALFILPNAIIVATPSHVRFSILIPTRVDETQLRQSNHFVGDAATSEAFADLRADVHAFWKEIGLEDQSYMIAIQKMAAVREELMMPTRFSPHWEKGVHGFQKYVVEMLVDG